MSTVKTRITALILLILGVLIAYFVYASQTGVWASGFPFKLGLDLNGGTHLVYRADTSQVPSGEVNDAMDALAQVVERRVNLFGVSEPLVQVEQGGVVGTTEHRLIVELPGISDIDEAVALIGKTPDLEFRLFRQGIENMTQEELLAKTIDEVFLPAELTGRSVKRADVSFNQGTPEPSVSLMLTSEGADIFARLTRENVNRVLTIFLDGVPIQSPVIREEIRGGQAEISGGFTLNEAKTLVRDLNYGALPLPIELVSTQTIGATLGAEALKASLAAGVIAFAVVALFLILWYRLPGLVAVVALVLYGAINLALFKLIPVTLTSAGIAGFILSLGMAVDANILIFERMKEELKRGKALPDAMREGFARAWLSIRDSNLSSIITALILYYFASTAVIKGFALVFGLGVLVSMFSALTASRTFLMALALTQAGDGSKVRRFIFGSGIH